MGVLKKVSGRPQTALASSAPPFISKENIERHRAGKYLL
jgi:hypothetical protein